MSLILDALKKSETERQRQDAPSIASIPEKLARDKSSKGGWIIGLLLIVIIGLLLVVILMRKEAVEDTPNSSQQIFMDKKDVSASSPKITEPEPSSKETNATVLNNEVNAPKAIPPMPVNQSQPNRGQVADGLPTFNELRAKGILRLGDLHLDIHVYSSEEDERFIFLNMSKYTEGMTLAEGPILREITPDGVVLEHMGTRFLLPRE